MSSQFDSLGPPPLPRFAVAARGKAPILAGKKVLLGAIIAKGGGVTEYFVSGGTLSGTRLRFDGSPVGWQEAWREFATREPSVAAGYLRHLVDESQRQVAARSNENWVSLKGRPRLAAFRDLELVGGFSHDPLVPGGMYDAVFLMDSIAVLHQRDPAQMVTLHYSEMLALRVDGPGAVKTGGHFVGGGFGLQGAAEGILFAALLNAVTTRTSVRTFLELQDLGRDFILMSTSLDTRQVSERLMAVMAKVREATREPSAQAMPASSAGLASEIQKLVEFRDRGVLTEDEFQLAKQRLLG